MKRRELIRDLFIVGGGFVLAASCRQKSGKAAIVLKNVSITTEQEQLLHGVASAIIPTTDTPGAGELGCHLFVLKMLDDCYGKTAQEKFIKGIDALDAYAQKTAGSPFVKCSQAQQRQWLNEAENEKAVSLDIFYFFSIMKERTLEGYLTSQYVLTNINKYEFIPSEKYNGFAQAKL